ncbi:MAG: efflux RND transporter periplasmic adaptor subunit [Deltaproteobacteria bacterium]|jgi:RND family efflux transporter MFP subunit|nr:efflux RND transporter periplasmic adaptor subunit [Deltaproteobacteria bacterium]
MYLGSKKFWLGLFFGISFLLLMSACREEVPKPIERIRAIKTITVAEKSSGPVRKFSGVVEAVDSSILAFEVPGNVKEVRVKVGDRVEKGQTIAVLNERTFLLDLQAAEAAVGRAKVQLADKKNDLDRFQRISKMDSGAVSQSSLDKSKAAYDSALKNVKYAGSQVKLVKRDLEKTTLTAPFNGIIGEKYVDPFQEVKRGEHLFILFSESAMEVAVQIPETAIDDIHLDQSAEIRFPTVPDHTYKGVVSEISSVAGTANAFPVKVVVVDAGSKIRPGMTAEITLMLSKKDQNAGYLVPLSAIAKGGDKSDFHVFIFDKETSTVKKTPVKGGGVRGNWVGVTEGVKAGDIIVVAGVTFLEDGQKVKLMKGN